MRTAFLTGPELSSQPVPAFTPTGGAAAAGRTGSEGRFLGSVRLVTFTLAGSLGNWKNRLAALLEATRFSLLTSRFGQPETAHLTMLRTGPEPDRTEPAEQPEQSWLTVDVRL